MQEVLSILFFVRSYLVGSGWKKGGPFLWETTGGSFLSEKISKMADGGMVLSFSTAEKVSGSAWPGREKGGDCTFMWK